MNSELHNGSLVTCPCSGLQDSSPKTYDLYANVTRTYYLSGVDENLVDYFVKVEARSSMSMVCDLDMPDVHAYVAVYSGDSTQGALLVK